jgi:hypothetical protein
MPNYFPCPNNQCNYQFDADILPPAAMVTCPLCRTRFPYRANRPAPAPTAPASTPASELHPPPLKVVNLRERPKDSGVLTTVLWVGGFCIVLALLVVGLTMRGRNKGDNSTDAIDAKFNIKVEPFPAPWENDASAQKAVDANVLGRKRSSPDGWVAVAAQDFVDREPRVAELNAFMRSRLVGENGLRTPFFEEFDGENWAGQSAIGVRFAGDLNEMQVRGEAFAMSYKGIAYVFYAWAPESEWAGVRDELVALREKIRPASFRERWEEKRASTEVHSVEGAGYQVEDVDGVWVRGKPAEEGKPIKKTDYVVDDVKEIDPAATMAFRARYQRKGGGDSLRRPAETFAEVVELPGGGDPLEAAKAHVVERIKKDFAAGNVPDIKLEAMTRSLSGTPLPAGGPSIGRFIFRNPLDRDNRVVYVISAMSIGGKIVAVEARASEVDASFVDEWMVRLAGSLKAR